MANCFKLSPSYDELEIGMKKAENRAPLGMVMELSNNIELHNFDIKDSHQLNLDNFELTCDAGGKAPLCHSMHSFIK